jgi:ribosomal protein S16
MLFLKFKKIKANNFSIIISEKKSKKILEKVGTYLITKQVKYIFINFNKVSYWLSKGAQVNPKLIFYLEILDTLNNVKKI